MTKRLHEIVISVENRLKRRNLPGRIERFVKDNTTLDNEKALLDQAFIKDEKKSVEDYVKSFGDVEIVGFKRVSLV